MFRMNENEPKKPLETEKPQLESQGSPKRDFIIPNPEALDNAIESTQKDRVMRVLEVNSQIIAMEELNFPEVIDNLIRGEKL